MNRFYHLPRWLQWVVAIGMFSLMIIVFIGWFAEMTSGIWGIFLILLLAPLIQLLATPLFRLLKVYTYLSPMLLVYAANEKRYDLHNGTSFDYLFAMNGVAPGRSFRHQLLAYYIEGLLRIIAQVESGRLRPSLIVRGSSYFFSEQTAKRLGFEVSPTNFAERFNLVINYIDLLWMYSLSKGKISFPNLRQVRTATTTGEELVLRKEYLLKLQQQLLRHGAKVSDMA